MDEIPRGLKIWVFTARTTLETVNNRFFFSMSCSKRWQLGRLASVYDQKHDEIAENQDHEKARLSCVYLGLFSSDIVLE